MICLIHYMLLCYINVILQYVTLQSHYNSLFYTMLQNVTLLYIMLCCAVLRCAALRWAGLGWAGPGPGRAGPCCAVLCCAVLCWVVLCCTVLHCAELCCAVPCCVPYILSIFPLTRQCSKQTWSLVAWAISMASFNADNASCLQNKGKLTSYNLY